MEKQLIIVLLTTLFLSFYNLGNAPIESWDEARHCATAIEMINNSDWFNYYYVGQPDTWIAKPPLGMWAFVVSLKTFGYNAFALRFPSAIATLLILLYSYKLIRLYENAQFALISCLIMLSVKGIIGFHVGRTGDFDAMLLALLMIGVYYFVKYLLEKRNRNLIISATGFGLAFWVKGPAMIVLFPGLLLFLIFSKQLLSILSQKITWLSIVILLFLPILYLVIMQFVGNQFEETKYIGSNSVETMFLYDIMERFTNKNFETEVFDKSTWGFFPIYLDTKFNIWNYLFYCSLALLIFKQYIPQKYQLASITKTPLLLLSVCIWFSLGIILTFLTGQRLWYLAPTLPFIAITTYYGVEKFIQQSKFGYYIIIGLLIFTLGRQTYQLSNIGVEKPIISKLKSIEQEIDSIYLPQTNISQDVIANAYLLNKKMVFEDDVDLKTPLQKRTILILPTSETDHNRALLKTNNQFLTLGEFELYFSRIDKFPQ